MSSLRPSVLDPLFAPAASLPGIGQRFTPLLDRLLGEPGRPARVIDVLFHLPRAGISREIKGTIADAPIGETVTLAIRVAQHYSPPPGRSRAPYRVLVEDETGDITLVYFRAQRGWIEKLLPVGETRYISGKIELRDGMRQMVHPERVLDQAKMNALPAVEAVYGQTEGVSSRMLAKFTNSAMTRLPALPEWQDAAWITKQNWPSFVQALTDLHNPKTIEAFSEEMLKDNPARKRLAYDEMLASQLALALVRNRMRRLPGRTNAGDGTLLAEALKTLPFELTKSQSTAVADIRRDLVSDKRMLRLLHGDVGSGKTVIAFLTMVSAVEAGRQAALMAPTEILARQHLDRLKPLAENLGLTIALLTGRDKGKEKRKTLEELETGTINIIIGTHALFQDNVIFKDLGIAIVDEQHRFGVHQRLALSSKGQAVDVLVMTATPIPRTLTLTYFGDMDVSVLHEKPAGRKPVLTRLVSLDRLDEVVSALQRAIEGGNLVYWVCPLVSESEVIDLAAAEERFELLKQFFGDSVGLVHGQMKGAEKDEAMARFCAGQTKILVSTTVIEVGVDVPAASIMVIEHAERFGLAQLHQLRGRIGRGKTESTCILLYKGPLGETARARLEMMRETDDGFRIAEADLKLRGEGEILGTRQSGMPGFRLANLEIDQDLLVVARDDARLIIEKDEELTSQRGEALRLLLYLFERDAAIRLMRAG